MFSTSLSAAVLVGAMSASASIPAQPSWQADYRTAMTAAAEQHKPVAVFIGQGGDAAAKVVREGALGADAAKALKDGYVCLNVDTTTDAGKAVAASFGMQTGLVISDRTGAVQALRHEGTVSQADLTRYVGQFAAPANVIQTVNYTTADAPPPATPAAAPAPAYQPAPAYYPAPSTCAGGNCGGYAPSYPTCVGGNCGGGFSSGGCPGGNCGGSSRGGFGGGNFGGFLRR